HVRSRQFLQRDRTDADRTARQRLPSDLHLAADHQKSGGADCAQRPLLRERSLDGAEQSLLSPIRPAARRRQRRRGRALQRQSGQPAVQYPVPRRRYLPAAATAGGQLPDPQSERPTHSVPTGWREYLRHHPLGHRRPHLHQDAETGASLQALSDDKVLGHDNNFVIGGSVDRSKIGFRANSELGYIDPDLFVGPNAAIPGTGQIIHTAGNLGFSPVSLAAWQTYYGAYFNETFDLTNRLSLTGGGRYNLAAIDMADLFGTSPDLSASYTYARFNP